MVLKSLTITTGGHRSPEDTKPGLPRPRTIMPSAKAKDGPSWFGDGESSVEEEIVNGRRLLSLRVDRHNALSRVVSKAADARCFIPELADDDSPEGWEVTNRSRARLTSNVGELITTARNHLDYELPPGLRGLPQARVRARAYKRMRARARTGASMHTRKHPRARARARTGTSRARTSRACTPMDAPTRNHTQPHAPTHPRT